MSKTLPLLSQADLAKHNTAQDCWVTLYNRKVYNVTKFLDEHPGGDDLILEYAGKDITEIMGDAETHEHSESAYEMLEDDMLVGYLATPEEERDLLNNRNKTPVEVKLTKEAEEQVDLYEFHDELPALEKLSIQTDFSDDNKKHKFLDLNKPLLPQMLTSTFDKDFYLDQVHRPRHYGKGSAPLFGNFLEPVSLTPWWVVPVVWLPVNLYIFSIGFSGQSKITALSFWALGLFVWTLIEYCMHRFLFHLDGYLPNHRIFFTIHFLLHGVHHYLPMDKYRLVMPPTLFVVLAYPFYRLVFAVLPYYIACSAFAGGTLGYIMYDVTHYVLHHTRLPKYFHDLKTYHLEHHYKNYELGFGVTSRFWDVIFNTEITSTFEKRK
ncbi:putative ceramide very long chain fatty acid hydroxylase [Clavispora lusitaniae]|uniref:Ceramide very long chain fatty acid hydroxylase n=2 Tax=Clavispora lusitaniae TaxID=36911 RepID=A0ACD0WDN7_CLALS|nr:Ceramide very long chain fatty acid hydroxylase SCS7 [Clavispora lusitaniae]OVF06841.1 putative ceramide very long chain fatty acid hydroxylase [Clavispora lusitaniae]QFZ25587.1 putative ceramide very long chain fatty acid hydroxylase [Clavispora lusitaniae]QFZ31110.1 putative ceramide very long chain fatty acid hydroxylase [Clavispora lusitaniae]QFZ36778.1 putative ceramide very long chain fatty acid hydroxylase [Clavispora lusitaniae]